MYVPPPHVPPPARGHAVNACHHRQCRQWEPSYLSRFFSSFLLPAHKAPSSHLCSQPRLAATVPTTTIRTREHHGSPTSGLRDPDRHRCAPSLSFFFLRETNAQASLPLFSGVAQTASASFSQTTATEAAIIASSSWTGTLLEILVQFSPSSHQCGWTLALVRALLSSTRWVEG